PASISKISTPRPPWAISDFTIGSAASVRSPPKPAAHPMESFSAVISSRSRGGAARVTGKVLGLTADLFLFRRKTARSADPTRIDNNLHFNQHSTEHGTGIGLADEPLCVGWKQESFLHESLC